MYPSTLIYLKKILIAFTKVIPMNYKTKTIKSYFKTNKKTYVGCVSGT